MIGNLRRPRRGGGQGQSAVEFALVAPIFFALLFGIIASGILFFQASAVSDAAQGGARAAIVKNASTNNGLSLSGGCATGLPISIQAAAQRAANILAVNPNSLCQLGTSTSGTSFCSGGAADTLVQTTVPGDAYIEVCVEGGYSSPSAFKVKVTYVAHPLEPLLGNQVVLTSTSILQAQ